MEIKIKGKPNEIKMFLDTVQISIKKHYKPLTKEERNKLWDDALGKMSKRKKATHDNMDDLIRSISAEDITSGQIEHDPIHLPKQS